MNEVNIHCRAINIFISHDLLPSDLYSSVGGAAVIKPEGRGFNSHPGQSFPLSLCRPISICRTNAHMVYGLKHPHSIRSCAFMPQLNVVLTWCVYKTENLTEIVISEYVLWIEYLLQLPSEKA